jgi:hypothetical protein
MPSLGRVQDALAQQGKPRSAIALAFHELEAMDLPFRRAIAPREGEPGGDRSQVLL